MKFFQKKTDKNVQELELLKRKVLVNELYNQDTLSLIQLYKMFNNEIFFPITRWSMPPREVLNICNDIILNKRNSIVEFGSGYSTIFICKLIKVSNLKIQFNSVDNDYEWQLIIKQKLIELGLNGIVNFVIAPIMEIPKDLGYKDKSLWYDVSVLNNELRFSKHIDLLIVDGPHGAITPFSRYPALPYLKNKIADNFSIYLDNTDRNEEKEIIKSWQSQIGGTIIDYTTYSHLTNISQFVIAPYGVKPKGWI